MRSVASLGSPKDLTLPLVIRGSRESQKRGSKQSKTKQSEVCLAAFCVAVVGRADLAKTQGNINHVQIGLGYRRLSEIGECPLLVQTCGNDVFRERKQVY